MDGILPAFKSICKVPKRMVINLIVDEAHAVAVLGENGEV